MYQNRMDNPLCISFKLFIEILIKQLLNQAMKGDLVVYILQIVH